MCKSPRHTRLKLKFCFHLQLCNQVCQKPSSAFEKIHARWPSTRLQNCNSKMCHLAGLQSCNVLNTRILNSSPRPRCTAAKRASVKSMNCRGHRHLGEDRDGLPQPHGSSSHVQSLGRTVPGGRSRREAATKASDGRKRRVQPTQTHRVSGSGARGKRRPRESAAPAG